MIDPAAAQSLRKLFTASAGGYPHLLNEAEIILETAGGTKCRFKTKNPAQTADLLEHILRHKDGIFDRTSIWNVPGPLYFRMQKRVRLGADRKEHCLLAFNFTFYRDDRPGALWLSDPEMTDYYWQGDTKIENRPPFSCSAPPLRDVIAILRRAGEHWHDVNFITEPGRAAGAHLRLVHSRP